MKMKTSLHSFLHPLKPNSCKFKLVFSKLILCQQWILLLYLNMIWMLTCPWAGKIVNKKLKLLIEKLVKKKLFLMKWWVLGFNCRLRKISYWLKCGIKILLKLMKRLVEFKFLSVKSSKKHRNSLKIVILYGKIYMVVPLIKITIFLRKWIKILLLDQIGKAESFCI